MKKALLVLSAISLILFSFMNPNKPNDKNQSNGIYDIPLMIAGVAFGPAVGGIVGFVTDWIYSTTQGWPIGLFTLSSILWGFIPGLLMIVLKKINVKTILVIVLITSIAASRSWSTALFLAIRFFIKYSSSLASSSSTN